MDCQNHLDSRIEAAYIYSTLLAVVGDGRYDHGWSSTQGHGLRPELPEQDEVDIGSADAPHERDVRVLAVTAKYHDDRPGTNVSELKIDHLSAGRGPRPAYSKLTLGESRILHLRVRSAPQSPARRNPQSKEIEA